MQELIEYIAKNLASKPDEVKVTSEMEDDRIILRLEVAQEDKGKIIGRQGRVAQAMRTILRVAAIKEGSRVVPGNSLAPGAPTYRIVLPLLFRHRLSCRPQARTSP